MIFGGGSWVLLELDLESEQPIYLQIYNQIIKGISKGVLKDGEQLPSVRQLASDIGVHKNTVVKAYDLLKLHGIISVHRRVGVIIRDKEKRILTDLLRKKLEDEIEVIVSTALCFQLSPEGIIDLVQRKISEF